MSFERIQIKNGYRTSDDNIIEDFLIPALRETKLYKRAAGFFSSSALVELSRGISGLVNNGGHMQLIVSPKLSEEDIKAIKDGYKKREDIISESLIKGFNEKLEIDTDKDRLALMSSLISRGILDIKVAVLDTDDDFGMYHEKIGVMIDEDDNKLAFNGSYNESLNSYVNNFESLDVYSSLKGEFERTNEKNIYFDKMWNNTTNKLQVINMPDAIKNKILEIVNNKEHIFSEEEIIKKELLLNTQPKPCLNRDKLYEYQNEAIDVWKSYNYKGIFDMATGTGKTYTAIGAATQLYKDLAGNLAVIIICPYTHLVEQWAEDLNQYGFSPIVGYGESSDKHWKEELSNKVLLFKLGSPNDRFFCFITTNASFKRPFIQSELEKIQDKNVLFIADEAHNLGAPDLLKKLNNNFKYRLALSATFDRYNDSEGTFAITQYFSPDREYVANDDNMAPYCIHYDLKKAIIENKLTEYNYHPILTYLNEDELYEYGSLTAQISKYLAASKKSKKPLPEAAKTLLLKRAKLVAGSTDKLTKLLPLIKKQYQLENGIYNTLIYCGATTINDPQYQENSVDADDNRQINIVKDMIKNNFKSNGIELNIARFTSLEDNDMRKQIKDQFCSKDINIITAIKCLDEGVNIPAIKTAYILASSTNPREYVQRRGRVLRKYDGKLYAEIYDFITLPRDLDTAAVMNENALKSDLGLIRRELIRIEDFANTASNNSEIYDIIQSIKDVYGKLLNDENELEEELDYE